MKNGPLSHWALPTVSFDVNVPTRRWKKRKETLASFTLISRLQQRSLIICIREVIMIFYFLPFLASARRRRRSRKFQSNAVPYRSSFRTVCALRVYRLASIYNMRAYSTRRATTIMSVGNDRWIRLVLMTSAVVFHFFGRLLHPPRQMNIDGVVLLSFGWGRWGCVCATFRVEPVSTRILSVFL